MAKMAVIFPPPGTALTTVTSLAGGDSRLSALVNSQSCEGQEPTYNEDLTVSEGYIDKRSGVNGGQQHHVSGGRMRVQFNPRR